MIAQIDFDGTLALGDNSEIEKMHPNYQLIQQCNKMYCDGIKIVVCTARGAKSCNTLADRINKYDKRIRRWLSNSGLMYHELSFNKEYADIYIDDRAHNIKDTLIYKNLDAGFTKNKVRLLNDKIIKNTNNAISEKNWYLLASNNGIRTPNVYHCDDDTIMLEYISSEPSIDYIKNAQLLKQIMSISINNGLSFDAYLDRLESHLLNNNKIIGANKLMREIKDINPQRTFNHGDFSISNILLLLGKPIPIDPIYTDKHYQSYVIDISKNLFSILFYLRNTSLYRESLNYFIDNFDVSERTIKILMASESVRVSTYNAKYNDITNNLIYSL